MKSFKEFLEEGKETAEVKDKQEREKKDLDDRHFDELEKAKERDFEADANDRRDQRTKKERA